MNRRDGPSFSLIFLILSAGLVYLTAVAYQPLWWSILAGLAIIGSAVGSISASRRKR